MRGTSEKTTRGWDVPVSLTLAVIAVIVLLMALTAALYWRENKRAEVRRPDAGRGTG